MGRQFCQEWTAPQRAGRGHGNDEIASGKNIHMDSSNRVEDIIVLFSKGGLGAIPFAGPLLAELVGQVIPNQRMDRLEEYARILDTKLASIETELLDRKKQDPGFVDLFEDSLYQAARALSQERLEYIASLIKNSLTEEEIEYVYYKQLLALLGEINDVEILILKLYSLQPGLRREFWDTHEDALQTPLAVMGSPQQDIESSTIHASFKAHLVRLGLLKIKFQKPKKGEIPEFDEKTGMMKAKEHDITPLGRLLIRGIDHESKNADYSEEEM
jgi:hypothetical protein